MWWIEEIGVGSQKPVFGLLVHHFFDGDMSSSSSWLLCSLSIIENDDIIIGHAVEDGPRRRTTRTRIRTWSLEQRKRKTSAIATRKTKRKPK